MRTLGLPPTDLPANTSAVVAKFNGDAYPDIVLVTAAGRQLVPGTPDGRFTGSPVTIEAAGGAAPTVQAAGDVDADGDQDVVGAGTGFVRVLLNNGGGTFTAAPVTGVPGTAKALTTADLDEDGKADPVAVMEDGRIVVVRSRGGVTDLPSGLAASSSAAVSADDLDGDSHLDLVAGNAASDALRVLSGNGAGGFCGPQTLPSPTFSSLGGVATGDLSGDGLADIAVVSIFGQRTDLLRNTTAIATTDAQIDLPHRGIWVSEAPFTASLSGAATDVEWDFGEGRTWTEGDLKNPECASFVRDDGGPTHAYSAVFAPKSVFALDPAEPFDADVTFGVAKGVDGSVPPEAPPNQTEVRRTYLVRARFTTPGGAKAIVARTVVVRPDTPPKPLVEPADAKGGVRYRGLSIFTSPSTDVDDVIDPERDEKGRDEIRSYQWDFRDGSPVVTTEAGIVAHDFLAGRLHGAPLLTDFIPTGADTSAQAASVAKQATALGAAGPAAWTGSQPVALTLTDRSGRTARKEFSFARQARIAPDPALVVTDAQDAKGKTQKLTVPIIAGKTQVKLDLSPTKVDRNGQLAFHVLQIGQPSPPPCPPLEKKKCTTGNKPALRPTTATLNGGPSYPTFVVSDEQLAQQGGIAKIVFPKSTAEGKPLSVLDTVYDESGAVGRTRYDGFVVQKPDAQCVNVQGREVGPAKLVFSGSCVNEYDGKKLLASTGTITLNGVKVRPEPGKAVVVAADCNGSGRVLSRNALPAKGSTCGPYLLRLTKAQGALEVLAGDDAVARIPEDKQGLLTREDSDGKALPFAGSGERYQGFEVKGGATLAFESGGGGKSAKGTLEFDVDFPKALAPPGVAPTTGHTTVVAYDFPKEIIVSEFNGYAIKAVTAGKEPAPPAPKIETPKELNVGPIPLGGLTPFTYDPATDTFAATAKDVPIPVLPGATASLTVVLRDGGLVRVEGDADVSPVPLAVPVLYLTGFGFTIEPQGKGLRLQGRAKFGDPSGLILAGEGAVTSDLSSDFSLAITGSATIVKLLPAQAFLTYAGGGVKFGASTGASFGPVSFSAALNGGFKAADGDKPAGFQIGGNGRACLFVCLGINGLASERAVAGCGSVDLVFTTLTAGFGYVFGKGPNVFVGSCNLSPYQSAASLREANADGSFRVPLRAVTEAISVKVVADGPLRAGTVPQVEVLDADKLVVARTTPELGATSTTGNVRGDEVDQHVYVEQDPTDSVVRFLIPKPRDGGFKGAYTVRRMSDSDPAITSTQVAYSDPAVDNRIFSAVSLEPLTKPETKAVVAKKIPIVGIHPSDPSNVSKGFSAAGVSVPSTVEPED